MGKVRFITLLLFMYPLAYAQRFQSTRHYDYIKISVIAAIWVAGIRFLSISTVAGIATI